MKQTKEDVKKVQGGYSDIRLWPCYSIVGFSMLFLMPKLGLLFSHLLIYAVVVLATAWALPRMKIVEKDIRVWRRDVEFARANGLEYPDCHDYEFMKGNTVKVAKKVKQPRQKAPRFKLTTTKAFNA